MPEVASTKLQPPRLPAHAQARPALLRDVAPPGQPLTVIVAPAGWGKTTLLAQWYHSGPGPLAACIGLDRLDDEPVRFWTAIVESLRAAGVAVTTDVPATPRAAGPELWHVVVPGLIDDLAAAARPVVLVIDDYQHISVDHVHDGLRYLVEHLPERAQIVVATRQEPPLGLARLRAQGALAEVRVEQLALAASEVDAHVRAVAGVELDAADLATLHRRSEGWPAGVHLAALSLRDRDDPAAFVATFAGDHRHVADYLTNEVFARIPDDLSRFLRRCSVLHEFDLALCRAVTDDEDAAERLSQAEELGLFVMGLDDARRRYRMHALVSSWLRHRLSLEAPAELRRLHRRAAQWYEANGDPVRAGDHALAAADVDLLRELVTRHSARLLADGHVVTLGRWLRELPEDRVRDDPDLALVAASTAATAGDLGRAERLAAAAQAAISASSAEGPSTTALELGVTQATISLIRRDLIAAERIARAAAALDHDPQRARYGSAHVIWATALLWLDRCEQARDAIELVRPHIRTAFVARQAAGVLATALVELGEGRRAERVARAALEDSSARAAATSPETVLSRIALGAALADRAELAEAERQLLEGIELSRQWSAAPQTAYGQLQLARLRLAQGLADEVRSLVGEAAPVVEAARTKGLLARVLGRTERMLGSMRGGGSPGLPEVLTGRETDVLRLLPSALTQREIGVRLGVSLDTVKTHSRNLYDKLGVSSRAEAVARARELDLL